MKSITVKFEFHDLEGYEDADDELIIEDHLRGCKFDDVGFEIIPEWISVEDRLPEPGNYLVVWNSLASQKYPNLCSKFDVLYWTGLSWGAPVNEKQPVLFWMPLPKAPDTKEEE